MLFIVTTHGNHIILICLPLLPWWFFLLLYFLCFLLHLASLLHWNFSFLVFSSKVFFLFLVMLSYYELSYYMSNHSLTKYTKVSAVHTHPVLGIFFTLKDLWLVFLPLSLLTSPVVVVLVRLSLSHLLHAGWSTFSWGTFIQTFARTSWSQSNSSFFIFNTPLLY